jgi:DeoR/GlpR family transcriptional regulator of sugar metabolism
MWGEERRQRILEQVTKKRRVSVRELQTLCDVSSVTIRNDLQLLSRKGLLVRAHGGAVAPTDVLRDHPLTVKESLNHYEKRRIAEAAVKLIRPRQTIILDAGTTTLEIARRLKETRLPSVTVITHAMNVASVLADVSDLTLIMIGGILRPVSQSFVGPQAEQMLRELHADHFFLGVDGLDLELGPSTPGILEAKLNSLMMEISKEVTVVADATKIGRRSLTLIEPFARVHRVITDKRVSTEAVAALRERTIEVVVV